MTQLNLYEAQGQWWVRGPDTSGLWSIPTPFRTSLPSVKSRIFPQSTCWSGGSPASQFRMQDGGKLKVMNAGCGLASPLLLNGLGLALWSQKTSEGCSLRVLRTSSLTLPDSGMMRSGLLYQRQRLERCTGVIVFGSSRGGATQTKPWPTPAASDGKWRYSNAAAAERRRAAGKQVGLEGEAHIRATWPTLTARDHKDSGDCANVPVNGLLGRAVGPSKASGPLNPTWVEWLMGFPRGWTDFSA
jgi:DNA (cytosine-5)-methyltransferase 1